jgi:DNA mismatch endonuclease (patch repair protein)
MTFGLDDHQKSTQNEDSSYRMSRVRSRNTSLDLAMRKILLKSRIHFRMYPRLFGNPDFLVEGKTVIFCDSGFWHGRNWPSLRRRLRRGSNPDYWIAHILKNRRRDREVSERLHQLGYRVIRLSDKEIINEPDHCLNVIHESYHIPWR